jgi:xanthine dehydrogenase molybdopterin-binding subunit B
MLVVQIDMMQDSPFNKGVLSSKASGEPPLVLAVSGAMAARMAIASARSDAGDREFFSMPLPITVDVIQQLCLTQDEHLVV